MLKDTLIVQSTENIDEDQRIGCLSIRAEDYIPALMYKCPVVSRGDLDEMPLDYCGFRCLERCA